MSLQVQGKTKNSDDNSGELNPAKRQKVQCRYTPQETTVPLELMPTFNKKMTHEQWCLKKSYTVAVTKAGVNYRVSVNWDKQSLWIYGGASTLRRNWAFNVWGGVDKAWEAALETFSKAEDLD